jgi:ATP synthase protein I
VAAGSQWRAVGRYGTVGIELVLSIAIGYVAGHWADGKLGGKGWVTLAGVVVGLYAGFRAVFKAAKAAQREMERLDREEAEEKRRYLERARGGRSGSDDSPR